MMALKLVDNITPKLEKALASFDVNLSYSMAEQVVELAQYVQAEKLSGQVLNIRSGRLINSISSDAQAAGNGVVQGRVFTQGVPYAAIHEYGGRTSPHTIVPKDAAGWLVFVWQGSLTRTKRVNHPGSVMPERSYLRTSLAEKLPEIRMALAKAALKELGL